jgi:hypothetical protein
MIVDNAILSPRERVSRCIRGIKPDKIPTVVINSNTFMCQYYGVTVPEYVTDHKVCAELNINFIREFEVDSDLLATGYILYGAGTEIGVEWKFAGENFPGHIGGPLKSEEDLRKMEIPKAPSGYFKTYCDAITIINKALGDTHHLKASFLGPFSLCCFLHGIEETLMDSLAKPEFFSACMVYCTELSVYLGKNLLKTGLRYPILNEIFLAPGMLRPESYHALVAPYVMEVQRRIGIEVASNSFTFMGLPNNPESQKIDAALYGAFFGVGESIDNIRDGAQYRVPGYPYPAAISGRALNNWDSPRIVAFLKEALHMLINELGIYPSISFSSVQAETKEKAMALAEKIKTVNAFRDEYVL